MHVADGHWRVTRPGTPTGYTAVHAAAEHGCTPLLDMLLRRVKSTVVNIRTRAAQRRCVWRPAPVTWRRAACCCRWALRCRRRRRAARPRCATRRAAAHASVCRLLVDKRAKTNCLSDVHESPLMLAAAARPCRYVPRACAERRAAGLCAHRRRHAAVECGARRVRGLCAHNGGGRCRPTAPTATAARTCAGGGALGYSCGRAEL